MASAYSTDLKLELMVTGEDANTWGDKTNSNWNLISQAVAGYQSITLTSTTTALVMSNASISNARNMVLEFTGTLSANSIVTIPSGIEKFYAVKDSTNHAGYTLTFKTASGTGFNLTQSFITFAYADGTNLNPISLTNLDGTIVSSQITANAITTSLLNTAAVTTAKIADNAVTTTQISSNAISTDKIIDSAVTTAKLNDNSVTAGKLLRKFTISTSTPSGGSDGDLWFQYSA
jgi:hypothetical protein